MFILDGLFGRSGPGASSQLPKQERLGSPHILMFEDGRWQPLGRLVFIMDMNWISPEK